MHRTSCSIVQLGCNIKNLLKYEQLFFNLTNVSLKYEISCILNHNYLICPKSGFALCTLIMQMFMMPEQLASISIKLLNPCRWEMINETVQHVIELSDHLTVYLTFNDLSVACGACVIRIIIKPMLSCKRIWPATGLTNNYLLSHYCRLFQQAPCNY